MIRLVRVICDLEIYSGSALCFLCNSNSKSKSKSKCFHCTVTDIHTLSILKNFA